MSRTNDLIPSRSAASSDAGHEELREPRSVPPDGPPLATEQSGEPGTLPNIANGLLSCPVCGCEACPELVWGIADSVWVFCSSCEGGGPPNVGEDRAIEAWNTRAGATSNPASNEGS